MNRWRRPVVLLDVNARVCDLGRVLALVALLIPATKCSDGPTTPTPVDRRFTLAPGAAAQVEDAGVAVRFDGVSGDSRCPADAFCVLGGDATVHITVLERSTVSEYELHTGSMLPVRHADLTFALVALEPYPFSARAIAPSEYRLTLRVSRQAGR